jgi:hypothetical protein
VRYTLQPATVKLLNLLHLLKLMGDHFADLRPYSPRPSWKRLCRHMPEVFFVIILSPTLAATGLISPLVISASKHKI